MEFLQKNSFKLAEDCTSILFDNEIEQIVSGPDFNMAIQAKATMISCVIEFLEQPQKGRRDVIPNDYLIKTCYEIDHFNNSAFPEKVCDKPRKAMFNSKLTSSSEVPKERNEEKERTQSGYVEKSKSSDFVLSNVDTNTATHNNLESLMHATKLLTKIYIKYYDVLYF